MQTTPDDELRSLFQAQRRRDHEVVPPWKPSSTRPAGRLRDTSDGTGTALASWFRWAFAATCVAGLAVVAVRWSAPPPSSPSDLALRLPVLFDGPSQPLFAGVPTENLSANDRTRSLLAFQSPSDPFLTSPRFLELP
ncbi:hypothetical protein [Humisphaera borealis]|uniref:Uncharacterized protein n=1 Tax=Humisphaera borealis TaxID=2807512 RepID=A0A7M2WYU3_9BACT|nr:hypothetical protein [Humisphaera borealis]QOV90599.1 hypothetical protein IPV69_04335 [Humisphaera borealis]